MPDFLFAAGELAELNAVTERAHWQLKEAHEIIAFAARYDKMTGLLNREHFLDAVRAAHQAGERDVLHHHRCRPFQEYQ